MPLTKAAADRSTCQTLDEALHGPNHQQWQKALGYEIGQLEKLGTWVIKDLPKVQPVSPCSEVLKEKQGPNSDIESFQLWIIAGGCRKIEGKNYLETFSTVAKLPSVCIVLANAVALDWEIHQVNVKSTYLNAPLKETVYMHIPHGAEKPGQQRVATGTHKGLHQKSWLQMIRHQPFSLLPM